MVLAAQVQVLGLAVQVMAAPVLAAQVPGLLAVRPAVRRLVVRIVVPPAPAVGAPIAIRGPPEDAPRIVRPRQGGKSQIRCETSLRSCRTSSFDTPGKRQPGGLRRAQGAKGDGVILFALRRIADSNWDRRRFVIVEYRNAIKGRRWHLLKKYASERLPLVC